MLLLSEHFLLSFVLIISQAIFLLIVKLTFVINTTITSILQRRKLLIKGIKCIAQSQRHGENK